MNGFLTALTFLTRLPAPPHKSSLESAFVWFPVVGLLLGAILALVDFGLRLLPISSLVISVLIVVLLLALSGALHADGLVDTCDAVFAHATPARRPEIMCRPRPVPF